MLETIHPPTHPSIPSVRLNTFFQKSIREPGVGNLPGSSLDRTEFFTDCTYILHKFFTDFTYKALLPRQAVSGSESAGWLSLESSQGLVRSWGPSRCSATIGWFMDSSSLPPSTHSTLSDAACGALALWGISSWSRKCLSLAGNLRWSLCALCILGKERRSQQAWITLRKAEWIWIDDVISVVWTEVSFHSLCL